MSTRYYTGMSATQQRAAERAKQLNRGGFNKHSQLRRTADDVKTNIANAFRNLATRNGHETHTNPLQTISQSLKRILGPSSKGNLPASNDPTLLGTIQSQVGKALKQAKALRDPVVKKQALRTIEAVLDNALKDCREGSKRHSTIQELYVQAKGAREAVVIKRDRG